MERPERFEVTLVSHTHWDRAWYVPYQEFRIRLVRLVDRLLALLRVDPEFRSFMLDGQTSVLEDYLEVRPQRAAELQALCRAGRVQIGPWYILADEFLSSPEALIRNLMWGYRMGVPYGGVMKAGYVPDGFGHIAQLPQIFRGFGIDSAFFWRGMGAEGDRLGGEFEWVAPDGSSVTATLMPYGYHNASNLGYGIHWGDTSQMAFDPDLAQAQIRKAVDQLQPFAHTQALLLMNGIDHAEPEPRLPQVVARANQEQPDLHVVQGTLLDHLRQLRAYGPELPCFTGEFHWGRYSEILQGVYSTRIYLKQANHRVETLLERYLEPLAAFAWLSGASIPEGTDDLIWLAWRTLIQSHAHDDLYGSGVDQTHRETLYRIEQAGQVGRAMLLAMQRALALQIDFSRQPGTPLLVFNPLNHPRQEVVTGEVDLDFDDPAVDCLEVVDGKGNLVPHQVLADLGEQVWMEVFKSNRKRRLLLAIQVNVPSCGYRAYFMRKGSRSQMVDQSMSTTGASRDGNHDKTSGKTGEALANAGPLSATNQFLRLTIAEDGTLEIDDLQTGDSYRGLHYFEDVEDAGDEYSYSPCARSQTISTCGRLARIELLHSGPCVTTFRVEHHLPLPAGIAPDRQQRSSELVDTTIISEISLYQDVPGVYIVTEMENRSRDHKLTAVFPTSFNPDQVWVDESFAVLARPVDLPVASGWVEDPTPLMHQRAFTDLSQDGRGLAVLNRGLPSIEVHRSGTGIQLALPLLRSVGWLSRGDLSTRRVTAGPVVETPEAQCLGHHRFDYAILPHAGDWREVYPTAYAYVAPLLLSRADTHEGLVLREMNITGDDPAGVKEIPWQRGGPLPESLSFLTLDPPDLVLSAVRRTADGLGLVVRGYSLSPSPVAAHLAVCKPLNSAWRANLNEERMSPLNVTGGNSVELTVRPGEVFTVELRF